jgi:hypothetical protein
MTSLENLIIFYPKSGPWVDDIPWAEGHDPWAPIKNSDQPSPPMVIIFLIFGPWRPLK